MIHSLNEIWFFNNTVLYTLFHRAIKYYLENEKIRSYNIDISAIVIDLGYTQDTFNVVKYVSEYLMKQFLWECALIVLWCTQNHIWFALPLTKMII